MQATGPEQDLAGLDGVPAASSEYRFQFAMRVARAEMPWVLRWWTLVFVLTSLLDHALADEIDAGTVVVHLVLIAGLIAVSFVLASPRVPDRALPWGYAAASTVLAMVFVLDSDSFGTPGRLALAVIVIATCLPFAHAWPPFLASAVVIIGTNFLLMGPVEFLALVVAAFAGAVLLWLRLRSLHRMADITNLANTLATTDLLTGLLNQRGLERTLPRVLATATRLVQPVMVWHLEIDGLREVNRGAGRAVGDQLIKATGEALRTSVRGDDLVARISGDEFLVVGLGMVPDAHDFPRQVVQTVRARGIADDTWAGSISYGAASGLLSITAFDDLLAQANGELEAKVHRAQ